MCISEVGKADHPSVVAKALQPETILLCPLPHTQLFNFTVSVGIEHFFLSNMFLCPYGVEFEDDIYGSSEAAFEAHDLSARCEFSDFEHQSWIIGERVAAGGVAPTTLGVRYACLLSLFAAGVCKKNPARQITHVRLCSVTCPFELLFFQELAGHVSCTNVCLLLILLHLLNPFLDVHASRL